MLTERRRLQMEIEQRRRGQQQRRQNLRLRKRAALVRSGKSAALPLGLALGLVGSLCFFASGANTAARARRSVRSFGRDVLVELLDLQIQRAMIASQSKATSLLDK